MLGYASRHVTHASRRLRYFHEPDAYGTTSKGRTAPLWKRSTVRAVADSGKGMDGGHRRLRPGDCPAAARLEEPAYRRARRRRQAPAPAPMGMPPAGLQPGLPGDRPVPGWGEPAASLRSRP